MLNPIFSIFIINDDNLKSVKAFLSSGEAYCGLVNQSRFLYELTQMIVFDLLAMLVVVMGQDYVVQYLRPLLRLLLCLFNCF